MTSQFGVSRRPSAVAALAVNMAVTPGGFAMLVGSGFSRAAGCPSAWDVLRDITSRWYAAEAGNPPSDDVDPIAWAREQLGVEPTYSVTLENLFQSQAQRQALLAEYFVGRTPTEAHRVLARLAAAGLVRVVITTNFDRLIETALDELGVRWSRVSSSAELASVEPRGVVPVYVLKVHGDYGSVAMKNTSDEISALDEAIEGEFQQILLTQGLLVVGYAGEDPAVAGVMAGTRPRLGLYWAVRAEPTEAQRGISDAVDGRFIVAEDADHFMRDLETRITAVSSSPTSRSPSDLYQTTVELIRRSDLIGLRELLKLQGSGTIEWFEEWLTHVSDANLDWQYFPKGGLAEWKPRLDRFVEELRAPIEGYLSIGLALVEYRHEDLPALLRWVDRLASRCATPRGGVPAAPGGACADIAAASILDLIAGALALRAWPALRTLLSWPDVRGQATAAVLSSGFHHYQFLETYAWPMPHAHRELLGASDIWKDVTHESEHALEYVIWAGVLIAIQAEATGARSQPAAVWSFNWNHWTQGVENLIRMVARDDEFAAALASTCGETTDAYRNAFINRYFQAHANVRGDVFLGGDPLSEQIVRGALGIGAPE